MNDSRPIRPRQVLFSFLNFLERGTEKFEGYYKVYSEVPIPTFIH